MAKVMMIGSAEKSGGGISSVIKLMKKMPVWEKYRCYWLGTQIQRNTLWKFGYALRAMLTAPLIMWRYDIVHFHIVPGITLLIQLPELLFAKLYRKRIVVELHIGNQLVPYADNRFFKWWCSGADIVLLLAQKWEQLFKESYAKVKVPTAVLYNACEMVPPIPFEEKKKRIIFAGTIHENKAPDLLLKAWASLKDKYPDWSLTFMGSGDIPIYQRMALDLGISDSVEFTGYIVGNEKKSVFDEASIYCMCSYAEGFPMVVLEAWAHSIALVTTPVGGLPDVIEDGQNCLVFPFGDSDALAEQLDKLIGNMPLREKLCKNGYVTAQDTFSLHKVSEKLDNIYSDLLK